MIAFDSLTLKAFIEEQKEFFEGARIYKIQQPTRRELLFSLRNHGQTRQFYINITPQYHHLCFASKENLEKRVIDIPQKPPMFCMLLRKYLGNSRIARINQPNYERILEFYIESYNELGDKIFLCLAIELMGKHSNIILYNYDTNIILGCAHNVGADKSRERELYGGLAYIYPPKQKKIDILDYNGEVVFENLSNEFYWFSKSFAQLCTGKSIDQLKKYTALVDVKPCISKDFSKYCLYSGLISESIPYETVNDMIDDYYSYYIALEKFKQLKTHYLSLINQRLKKVTKTLEQMEYQELKNLEADKYRLWADLIMVNLYNLKDYSKSISVYDYENDKNITIALDELKTLKENANKFYKLYNKAKTSSLKLVELTQDLKQKKLYLERVLYSITIAETINDLFDISEEVTEKKSTEKSSKSSLEPIRLDFEDGTIIYIGKNNKQNDYIISKLASEDDLWFHTKDCAGSHVLLKTHNLSDELILKCANLAKYYSSARDSSKIGVIYTKRKYIRKPPKSNLGYVTYKNEKEIVID